MKRYIKDNQGNLLEVSDLQAAIYQVAAYLSHLHDKAKILWDELEIKYWKDIYIKLCHLKNQQSGSYQENRL